MCLTSQFTLLIGRQIMIEQLGVCMEGSKTTSIYSWSMPHKLFLNECMCKCHECVGTINVWLQTCSDDCLYITTNLE